jgi:hypothetical protein
MPNQQDLPPDAALALRSPGLRMRPRVSGTLGSPRPAAVDALRSIPPRPAHHPSLPGSSSRHAATGRWPHPPCFQKKLTTIILATPPLSSQSSLQPLSQAQPINRDRIYAFKKGKPEAFQNSNDFFFASQGKASARRRRSGEGEKDKEKRRREGARSQGDCDDPCRPPTCFY